MCIVELCMVYFCGDCLLMTLGTAIRANDKLDCTWSLEFYDLKPYVLYCRLRQRCDDRILEELTHVITNNLH